MLREDGGVPVHVPAKPGKFEFDAEVTAIFQNMAERSIPNYALAHQLHARMLKGILLPGDAVLDVGASRGAFLETLGNEGFSDLDYLAIDSSQPMCDALEARKTGDLARVGYINVRCMDAASPDFMSLLKSRKFRVICCYYVLQFLQPHEQFRVLGALIESLVPGGVLLVGQKAKHYGKLGVASHEQYIQWRMSNGYTREEIEAKTAALRGSMFPMDDEEVRHFLSYRSFNVVETTRHLMFSTFMAQKETRSGH